MLLAFLGRSWIGLGRSWGDLGALLGRFWLLLGHLGEVFGASWGGLGPLEAVLGRLGSEKTLIFQSFSILFGKPVF